MAVILRQNLPLYGPAEHPGLVGALVELHDDRLVILQLASADQPAQVVLDSPLAALRVTGSLSTLTFSAAGIERRVDFATGVSAALAGPDSGTGEASSLLKKSGIYSWLGELRARGVPVSYRGIGTIWAMGLTAAAVILVGCIVFVLVTRAIAG